MSWSAILFVIVTFFLNFLMIPAQLIAMSGSVPASQDYERYLASSLPNRFIRTFFTWLGESITALTISALYLTWVNYITEGQGKYLLAWIIGFIAAIYPAWQAWGLARRERLTEPESYAVKVVAHTAAPITFIFTFFATLFFVLNIQIVSSILIPLVIFASILIVSSVTIMLLRVRKQQNKG